MKMENTSAEKITGIVKAQHEYFRSGATLDIGFRKEMLKKFMNAMDAWEDRLAEALR